MHVPEPFRHACRICGNAEGNRAFDVREMMFGTREVFRYFQCARCRCLQIAEVPPDLSRHYPGGYYSHNLDPRRLFAGGALKRWMKRRRDAWAVLGRGLAGRLIAAFMPNKDLRKLARVPLRRASRVLDVGCGTGTLLYTLRTVGFENLLGVDAYLERDIEYENGLRIERRTLAEVEGEWDLVMFHHSLEHMADQAAALAQAAQRLAPGGTCLVRLPVVDSWAWNHYGVNWVQLDAPRHLYLHSAESMAVLAAKAGLAVADVLYDSDDFQFWGSEQYAKDIPLRSERSWSEDPARSIFTPEQIADWKKRAAELNREAQGDQAAFYLKRP